MDDELRISALQAKGILPKKEMKDLNEKEFTQMGIDLKDTLEWVKVQPPSEIKQLQLAVTNKLLLDWNKEFQIRNTVQPSPDFKGISHLVNAKGKGQH